MAYYAKYAHEGDNTFFRHIDLNIRDLASSGRGANMIQGTVSLDDEKPDDCTMILPGMHKHIKEWDETLTARGLSTGALVHRIQDSMFTSEDEKRFGTKWTPNHAREGRYASPFLIVTRTDKYVTVLGGGPCSAVLWLARNVWRAHKHISIKLTQVNSN